MRYQQREAGANFSGDDFVSAMVTLTVPFWSKRNQQPRLRAAESGLGAAKSRYQERIRQAKATYFSLRSNYQTAEKTEQILNEKINAVINEINEQQVSYESGENLYSGVIEGQIILTKLKSDLVNEKARKDIVSTQIDALFVRGAQTNTTGGGQ